MTAVSHLMLKDVATLSSGGTPSKENSNFWSGSIPWLTPKDMSNFDGSTQDSVTEIAIGNGTRLAPEGAIYIAVRGMSLHNEIRIVRSARSMAFNQDIKAIVPKGIDGSFLYYALLSQKPNLLAVVESAGHGTGRLPTDKLSETSIPSFSLQEQVAIASLLAAIDDKITINTKINANLEKMAKANFKHWFIDFGPARAKIANQVPYLASEIWSLFPDEFGDDGQPMGWSQSTIGDEIDVVGGSTPSTTVPEYWGGEIAWATPKDLSSLTAPVLLSTERRITAAGLTQVGSGLLPAGTVLLSSRAPIGYLAITQIPSAINQGFIAMRCKKRVSNHFAWLWASAHLDAIKQKANGSTFQEISKSSFRTIPIVLPTDALLFAFEEIIAPLFDQIVSNEKENRELAKTRDFLLPKLMSGELRVGNSA